MAYFHPAGESVLAFDQGHCSCPVGFDCKHVVALVLAASQAQLARIGAARPAETMARPLTWEQSVQSWLGPQPAAGSGQPSAPLLGIELTLDAAAPPAHLRGRAGGDRGRPG